MDNDEKPLDPEAARFVAKVRRLMLIASATTFLAVAVVLAVVGYRVYHLGGSPPPAAEIAPLPAGAKVIGSAIGDGRIVLTVEIGGATELRIYDLNTLKALGRIPLAPK